MWIAMIRTVLRIFSPRHSVALCMCFWGIATVSGKYWFCVTWTVLNTLTVNLHNLLHHILLGFSNYCVVCMIHTLMLCVCYLLLSWYCIYILVYPPTGHHPIGELHVESTCEVPLDLVVLDLIHCKRTNVEHRVSDPKQVRKWRR